MNDKFQELYANILKELWKELQSADRGHLAPAADMAFSGQTMADSFFMSNMSPQKPAFNRGIWKELEALVRYFAITERKIVVVTGPILPKEKTVMCLRIFLTKRIPAAMFTLTTLIVQPNMRLI